jgi:acyl-CoA thioester hydrolase
MVSAFFPEGLPEHQPERPPFPKAPPPPPRVFTLRRKVAWHDVDSQGHVNNAAYLEYIEECGMQLVAAFGWPFQRMIEEGRAILIRRFQIRYRQPAALGDELEVASWASGVRRSTAVRHYFIRRAEDGELLVEVHGLGVWVDLASGRPVRFPAQFLEDFKLNLVSGEQG